MEIQGRKIDFEMIQGWAYVLTISDDAHSERIINAPVAQLDRVSGYEPEG